MRTTVGIAAGYVAMAMTVLIAYTLLYLAIGADSTFLPRSYEVSTLWTIGALTLTLATGVVGGWLTVTVSKSGNAVVLLAVIIIVLGLALTMITAPDPNLPIVRTGDVSVVDAMLRAREPRWMELLAPFVAAFGSLLGGRF